MQSNTYFKKVYNDLKKAELKKFAKAGSPMSFADLKILEYWVRIIDENPDGLNKASAFQLMGRTCRENVVKGFIDIFNPFITPKKKPARPKSETASVNREFGDDEIDLLDDFLEEEEVDEDECELDTQYCNGRLLRQICRYRKEMKHGCADRVTDNLIKAIVDVDTESMAPFLYKEVQDIVCGNFKKFALEKIQKGVRSNDPIYERAMKVKDVYRLNDDELEILLYMWLRTRDVMQCDPDGEFFGRRRHRFGPPSDSPRVFSEVAMTTGLSVDRVMKLMGKDSTLRKLGLCNEDMDIPMEVGCFLDGSCDSTGLKAFHLAEPGTVPFAQLQGNNPDAILALDLIKHHNWNRPLNILLYGVEGTGKTELAKALAAEAGLPLLEVSIDADNSMEMGRRFETRSQSLMLYRIRAAMLADWQCEKDHGIILIDEADLVLNGFEKGSLNHFFESVHTPIIWITNSISFTEKSSRRRFDFSMAFKGLAKDERLSMFESVLKAQGAEDMLTPEEKMKLVVEYPAMAGGFTIATRATQNLLTSGANIKAYPTMARLLKAHTNLLGIDTGSLRDVESHAPTYTLSGLNMEGSVDEIMEVVQSYDSVWKTFEEDSAPNSLNILLYGPPGTGKTEFVRHIARTLGRNLVIRRASDLLGMYVGQTEANIAAAFEEAERTKSILFFDEADSFLRDRTGAMQGHEVSKVNEILTRMENFKGIFVAATNFDSTLDSASRRRFALKLGFGYLKPEGVRHIWNVFFPNAECPKAVTELPLLTPGDFNAVNGRLRFLPESARTSERIEAELRKELQAKDSHAGRSMGF